MSKNRRMTAAVFLAAILLCAALLLFYPVQEACHDDRLIICIIGCILAGYSAAVVLMAKKKNWRDEYVFLGLFIPLSLAMMIALPIGRVPDEPAHLQRIWLYSVGQFAGTGLSEPENLLQGINIDTTTLRFVSGTVGEKISGIAVTSTAGFNTAVYPPLAYFPQALAMMLVRLVTDSRIVILYAGRFGGWIATILLILGAIRLLPGGKRSMIAISLIPVMLQEGMSAATDGITVGAVALLTAWVLRQTDRKTDIHLKQLFQLILLSLLVASGKMLYIPFLLLPLIIPKEQWRLKGGKIAGIITCWAVNLLLVSLWLLYCYFAMVAGQEMAEGVISTGNIMPQLVWLLQHPAEFIGILFNTVKAGLLTWLHTMLGSGLSRMNLLMPAVYVVLTGVGLAGNWLTEKPILKERRGRYIALCIIAALLSVLVMLIALYCWWTPFREKQIYGFQGRYLIPCLLPLFSATFIRKKNNRLPIGDLMLILEAVVSIACTARVAMMCLG